LVVEVEGPVHDFDASWAYDQRRKAWLEAEGYLVRSIDVKEIDDDIADVIDGIRADLHDQELAGHLASRCDRPLRRASPDTSP